MTSRIKFRPAHLLIAFAAAACLALAVPAPSGAVVIPANNQVVNFGLHTVDAMLIDYTGQGSFTTCGQFGSSGGYVFAHNCGTLDVWVVMPDCVNRRTYAYGWQNDNNAHNFNVYYWDNAC